MLFGQLVTLTAAGSEDAKGDSITYSRRFQSNPIGSTPTLANATSVSPTFTTDFAGFYVLSLIVKEGRSAVCSIRSLSRHDSLAS